MSDETGPFETWGGSGAEGDVENAAPPARSRIPARVRGPLLAGLITSLACVVAAVVAELASVGPFAGANTPPSLVAATPRLPSGLPGGHWQWQWIATGTPTSSSGQPLVRAWQLSRTCGEHGSCHIEFARQLEDPLAPAQTADRTELTPGYETPTAIHYNAQFPSLPSSCSQGGQSQPARLTDHFDLGWAAGSQTLVANEDEHWDCFGGSYEDLTWTTTRVPRAPVPPLIPDRLHASTPAAFRAAAKRTCTAMNAAAEPLARSIVADEQVIHSGASRLIKARAESDIAGKLVPLVPLSVKEYTVVPQPPGGALDRLWLRDVRLNQEVLEPVSAAFVALEQVTDELSRYDRTGSVIDRETALAEFSLFENDVVDSSRAGIASEHLEQDQLRLPSICVTLPAVAAIFTTPSHVVA